jgi:hypothetical protein
LPLGARSKFHLIESMKTFQTENGERWVATAAREDTDRHHGVWYLIFHREGDLRQPVAVGEVRWQTRATAERTLRTMSEFELRRRLTSALARHAAGLGPTPVEGRTDRNRTNVNAG